MELENHKFDSYVNESGYGIQIVEGHTQNEVNLDV